MSFQSRIMNLACYGQFLELGTKESEPSYRISLEGLTMSVPVTKELFDNPPEFGYPCLISGALTTSDFNGRPVAKHLKVYPLKDQDSWPSDGIFNRFEGLCVISKDSYFSKLGEKISFVRFDAMSFTYQYTAPQEVLDKFPTGEHIIYGQLKADQTMTSMAKNPEQKNKVTVWKCIPLGIQKPQRNKQ